MLDALVLYCHFGNGDIFESREFARAYQKDIEAQRYHYAHGKDIRIIADLNFSHIPVNGYMPSMLPFNRVNNDLYINMWIGRDGKYVLPGIGCTVEKLYDMHNEIRGWLGLSPLPGVPTDYIPNIDYRKYDTENVDAWISNHNLEKNILICNGPVQSNQAANFDFTPAISILTDKYPNYNFILTSPTYLNKPNIYYTTDITKVSGFDLNEISELSCICEAVIGRNSGPFVFCQTHRNLFASSKKYLAFTYQEQAAYFTTSYTMARKFWSGRTDLQGVLEEMEKVINE